MKATTLLKKDHAAVKKLFRAFEKATKSGSGAQKMAIFDQITMELEAHMKVEEEIFYPALKAETDKDGSEMILEGVEEHGVVKNLLTQLSKMKPSDENFDAKMSVVIESVEHHVEEEEEEMFPDAEKALGMKKLEELSERIELMKEKLFA